MNNDCFAFGHKDGKPFCKCLTEMFCNRRKCTFYKTKKQFDDGLMKYNGTTDTKIINNKYSGRMGTKLGKQS